MNVLDVTLGGSVVGLISMPLWLVLVAAVPPLAPRPFLVLVLVALAWVAVREYARLGPGPAYGLMASDFFIATAWGLLPALLRRHLIQRRRRTA